MRFSRPYVLALFALCIVTSAAIAVATVMRSLPTLVVVTCVCSSAVVLLLSLRRIEHHFDDLEQHHRDIFLKSLTSEIYAMRIVMAQVPTCSMPVSGWSMMFTNLHQLLELLDVHRPKLVVELGSGMSTIVIAKALKDFGDARMVSIEHDAAWASVTRRHIEDLGLESVADVRLRPLRRLDSDKCWYGLEAEDFGVGIVNMLIVDGPPAVNRCATIRFPALDSFLPILSDDAVVVLDDANRHGERTIVREWLVSHPDFEHVQFQSITGLAILRRRRERDRELSPRKQAQTLLPV